MQTAGIVESLDVLEQVSPGLVAGGVEPVVDPLGLEDVHVEDRSQVQPAFASGDVGEVGQPDLVGGRCGEVTGEPVRGDRIAMTAVRGPGPAGQRRQPADAGVARQALDP